MSNLFLSLTRVNIMQKYINTQDWNEYGVMKAIATSDEIDKRNRVFRIIGPPGIGKTLSAENLAVDLGCKIIKINCVSSMIELDFMGTYILKDGETKWNHGPVPKAIQHANEDGYCVLLINEFNALTPSTQMGLNPVLDYQGEVVLTQHNDELVKIDKGAKLITICTMNPDVSGINAIQSSVIDRISTVIKLGYPKYKKELEIISKVSNVEESVCEKYLSLAIEVRKAGMSGGVEGVISPRGIIDWINTSKVIHPQLAFQITVANRYSVSEREIEDLLELGRGADVSSWGRI